MVKKDEWYSANVRKPIALRMGAVYFADECFRLGKWTARGPEWKYEIPFDDIVQVEHQTQRGVIKGTLRDGTEFDFRVEAANPAKAVRQSNAMNAAIERIPIATREGGIRAVEQAESDRPEQVGCLGSAFAALVPVVAMIVAIF